MQTTDELSEISENFSYFLNNTGENEKLFAKHYEQVYQPGIFDTKTKRLMALCGAITSGCLGCILGQTKQAIANGATKEEILEVCSVMASLGGTMACSEVAYIIKYLKEVGMIQD